MKNKVIMCVCLVAIAVALIVISIICNKSTQKDKKDELDSVETVASIVESGYKLDIKSATKGVERSTDDQAYIITVDEKEYIGDKEKGNEVVSNDGFIDEKEENDQRDYWDRLFTVVYKNIFEHSSSYDFSNVNTWDTIVINNKKFKYNIIGDKTELVYEIDDKAYMLIEVNYISKVKYDKDGNILDRDVTDLTEEILKSENIAKAIRFKIKKYDPQTDGVAENKIEEVKPENSENVNKTETK